MTQMTTLDYTNSIKYQVAKFTEKATAPHLYGEGNGKPFQYSCLENPMDRGAW